MKWGEICSLQPFYEDFFALFYLEGDGSAKLSTNEEAIKGLITKFNPPIKQGEKVLSHVYRCKYSFNLLENQYICCTVIKEYIWDAFKSTGTILIMSQNPQMVAAFVNQFFQRIF